MIFSSPRRPVRPLRVALGAVVVVGALGGVVAGSEALRPPHPPGIGVVEADGADFRQELICPELDTPAGPDTSTEASSPVVPVTSSALYDCPATYDGRRVRLAGEVVGALLHRAGGAWTQLNDDAYAAEAGPLPAHQHYHGANSGLGVFLPGDVAARVDSVGGPRRRGDVLVVEGTFHLVDPDTREIAVVRVDAGHVRRRGGPVRMPPLHDRRVAGSLLALAALAVTVGQRAAVRRERAPRLVEGTGSGVDRA